MKNFIKGFATVIACGILMLGCTVSTSNSVEAEKQYEFKYTDVGGNTHRAVDCKTGIILYKYNGSGITSQKLDQKTLESFGCASQ